MNSEFEMILTDDYWRKLQLLRSFASENSIFNRFGCGSLETLQSPSLSAQLLEFNRSFCIASRMKLCISSSFSCETAENCVRALFSAIKPGESLALPRDLPYKPAEFPQKPYEFPQNIGKLVRLVPIKAAETAEFVWILEKPLRKHYKSKPDAVIAHLFAHEGPNSLFSLLKTAGFAKSLLQSTDYELNLSYFSIKIELTDAGMAHFAEVCALFFEFLRVLCSASEEMWREAFEELKKIEEIAFEFEEKSSEIEYVAKIARNMLHFPAEDVITGEKLLETFDFEKIREILRDFREENLFLLVSSKNFQGKTDSIEKFFGTAYFCESLPAFLREMQEECEKTAKTERKYAKKLGFPPKNEFIAENIEVLPQKLQFLSPKKSYLSQFSAVWVKQGNSFGKPQGIVDLKVYLDRLLRFY